MTITRSEFALIGHDGKHVHGWVDAEGALRCLKRWRMAHQAAIEDLIQGEADFLDFGPNGDE